MPFFKAVKAMEDYKLKIDTVAGNVLIIDMASKLESTRFFSLNDQDVFHSVTTDGDFLLFGDKLKLGASEVIDMAFYPKEN